MEPIDLSDLDEIIAADPRRSTKHAMCQVRRAIDEHPDRHDLIQAILDHPASARHASEAFARRDIDIPQSSVTRHRGGQCSCRRTT